LYNIGILDGKMVLNSRRLFNTIINVILLVSMNKIVQMMNDGRGI
jgi:putative aldouronate transport system permease protein